MKFSESWLREWVNPTLSSEALCDKLTMAGLEVEERASVSPPFSGIVIGQVLKVDKHPSAERLHVCEVNVGSANALSIVCGAANVKSGMRVPVAMLNAVLPNKSTIQPVAIRGVESQGMLCSAAELGLAEASEGLMALPDDAPIGKNIRDYLHLEDNTIEIGITPNRGDCLSIRGIAREVSALTGTPIKKIHFPPVKSMSKDTASVSISIKAPMDCPHYVGRVIRNVKADAETPTWMKEKLRRSGIRAISPIVDITNYVMLELGQPMHAFDLNTIDHEIVVRMSKQGERILLLDGSEKELDGSTLVIADKQKPLAIAGVMGGHDSSVTLLTRDIFFESAYFSPAVIVRQRQYYQLNSDSAYRFERGVDPTIQQEAIERATQLILDITGGEAGPVTAEKNPEYFPKPVTVTLSKDKLDRVLGTSIPEKEIDAILQRLHFTKAGNNAFQIPSFRSDISIPEDLIEEVARLFGYEKIPMHSLAGKLLIHQKDTQSQDLYLLRQALCDQGFHEIISYSFVDKKLQQLFDPAAAPETLINPLTADMSVMRTNLWPGLANTLLYNKSRQQHRIRLFEIGTCFIQQGKTLLQQPRLAGLITGLVFPEQWGMSSRESDFFDLKGNLLNILEMNDLHFAPETHPALHPGQTGWHLSQR